MKTKIWPQWLIVILLCIMGGAFLNVTFSSIFNSHGQSTIEDAVAASLSTRPEFMPYILKGATHFSCGYQGMDGGSPQYGGYIWGAFGNFIDCYSCIYSGDQVQSVWIYRLFYSCSASGCGNIQLPEMSDYTTYSFTLANFLTFCIGCILIAAAIVLGILSYRPKKA
jgi:hypothetical protein